MHVSGQRTLDTTSGLQNNLYTGLEVYYHCILGTYQHQQNHPSPPTEGSLVDIDRDTLQAR